MRCFPQTDTTTACSLSERGIFLVVVKSQEKDAADDDVAQLFFSFLLCVSGVLSEQT